METLVTWTGKGLQLVGETGDGAGIVIDHVLEGEERPETGARPMELMLLSLASCTAMNVISVLQKKRQPLKGLEVRVSGERAHEHPHVYTRIEVEYVIKGKDVDPVAVERSIELSETKYCSATAMLEQAAEITSSYRIEEE